MRSVNIICYFGLIMQPTYVQTQTQSSHSLMQLTRAVSIIINIPQHYSLSLCNMLLLLVLTKMYFVCGLGKWKEMKGDVVITNIYIFVETFLVSCVVFPLCFYVVCVLIIQQIQLSSWLKISFHRSSIEKG